MIFSTANALASWVVADEKNITPVWNHMLFNNPWSSSKGSLPGNNESSVCSLSFSSLSKYLNILDFSALANEFTNWVALHLLNPCSPAIKNLKQGKIMNFKAFVQGFRTNNVFFADKILILARASSWSFRISKCCFNLSRGRALKSNNDTV